MNLFFIYFAFATLFDTEYRKILPKIRLPGGKDLNPPENRALKGNPPEPTADRPRRLPRDPLFKYSFSLSKKTVIFYRKKYLHFRYNMLRCMW